MCTLFWLERAHVLALTKKTGRGCVDIVQGGESSVKNSMLGQEDTTALIGLGRLAAGHVILSCFLAALLMTIS